MAWNEDQQKIISLGLVPVLVIAPAGTGKTEVLAARGASLAQRRLVRLPQQILALTFTNRAVENLTSRLRRVFGLNYKDYVDVQNFHKFGIRLIKSRGNLIGIDPSVVIWPEVAGARKRFSSLARDRKDV